MRYRRLSQLGTLVSVLGFGASPLGNEFCTINPVEGTHAVRHAVANGINFFDVSPYYGRTLAEERLGQALSGLRDKVVISTKCGRYDTASFDFSAARIEASANESLRRLRTDYVDILFAHDIEFADREQILNETVRALKRLKQQGKARLIGVTGYPLKLLADVAVRGAVDIVMSYCHYNLLARDLDVDLAPVLKQHNIALVNASPFHMGILSSAGAPSWHPAPERVKQAGSKIVKLCETRGVNLPAAALRFCINHPYIASTLVGMFQPAQVDENLKALDTRLDPALLAEIDRLAGPDLNVTWPSGLPENQDQ
jgi:L-galactose dehydrogenase